MIDLPIGRGTFAVHRHAPGLDGFDLQDRDVLVHQLLHSPLLQMRK
jgi:hypothetical protein